MAGLGSVEERDYVYLSIAGGFVWNKKADESDPDYKEQTYRKTDDKQGEPDSGVRKGAQYANIDGYVKSVNFKQHEKYGESINIRMDIGQEKDYIVSVSTNNRYSQDLMKALLNADLTKPLFIKPYDFVGQDKKRASGCTFKQDGQKLEIKVAEAPSKEGDWFKSATKKAIKRFFEDLNDWYVAEVQEKVVPVLDKMANATKVEQPAQKPAPQKQEEVAEPAKEEVEDQSSDTPTPQEQKEEVKAPSPIKMKRAIKAYILENYEGKEMPKLSGDVLVTWYNLVLEEEELPFENLDAKPETQDEPQSGSDVAEAEVEEDDLDSEIDDLMNG